MKIQVQVYATLCNNSVSSIHIESTRSQPNLSEIPIDVFGRSEFKVPGHYEFVVPEGVHAISAIAIGGGGAGSAFDDIKGGNGGESYIKGLLIAGGGTSEGNKGGIGGKGTIANGGTGGSGDSNPFSHGGGGAAGGSGGQDAANKVCSEQQGGMGGSTELKYAGRGGNGRGSSQFKNQFCRTFGKSGVGAQEAPTPLSSGGGFPGRSYGGGGGGSNSGGGGGGGYSRIDNLPVTPGTTLIVHVGEGGKPVQGTPPVIGGEGGSGLVIITWGSQEP